MSCYVNSIVLKQCVAPSLFNEALQIVIAYIETVNPRSRYVVRCWVGLGGNQ